VLLVYGRLTNVIASLLEHQLSVSFHGVRIGLLHSTEKLSFSVSFQYSADAFNSFFFVSTCTRDVSVIAIFQLSSAKPIVVCLCLYV